MSRRNRHPSGGEGLGCAIALLLVVATFTLTYVAYAVAHLLGWL